MPDALRTVPRTVLDALDLSLDRLISKLKIRDEKATETPLADI